MRRNFMPLQSLTQFFLQMFTGRGTQISLPIIFLCSFFLFAERPRASDSISPGESLSGSQTIVSKDGRFELGFFTPGNSHNYYLGIWYKTVSVQSIIWVANREVPLSSSKSSELKILQDGNLVLLNPSKIPVWSSNITFPSPSSTVAVLLHTGNLVLRPRPDSPTSLWQSFDHPTDTWVPYAFVGMKKTTGEFQVLTSWKNSQDPAPGMYSHRLEPGGSNYFLNLWNGSVVYDHIGEWKGQADFEPRMRLTPNIQCNFVETTERRYVACSPFDDSILLRLVMDVSGQLKMWRWLDTEQKWLLFMSWPSAVCDVYSVCGAFGVCDQRKFPACSCLNGFEPRSLRDSNLNDWSGGCVRKSRLQCANNASHLSGQADVFSVVPGVKFPTSSQTLRVTNAEECRLACFNNCSCSAYAYDGACLIWNGQLLNLQKPSDAVGAGGTLYLRFAASEQPHSSGEKKTPVTAILGSILGFLALFLVVLILLCVSKRRASSGVADAAAGSLLLFSYSHLQQITKKFSVQLGKGGFGSVYAGELPDSTPVAVKKLEGRRQGEKQFRAEVRTLGTVQHVNLVRLRGFCCEGDKRLLVYDYMPKGSLDSHLFRSQPPCLDWRTRYRIALGTARGLAYLHEACRERIIHCDIKPENILLDESYQPKVADFGMAKLLARDFSRALTTVRGTIGYLAPEWASGLAITPKADVYSFGMMLLELVSGRRNTDVVGKHGKTAYFPLWAACEISGGGDVLSLLDPKLAGDADVEELTRVCTAACWCIQHEGSQRPTMGQVVQIMEGVLVLSVPPIPRSFLNSVGEDTDSNSVQA